MNDHRNALWLNVMRDTAVSYRRMIDATIAQLTDEELFCAPETGINSVANILRHLGGNLRSRWTDFLVSDGEKPDRDRDSEFEPWTGDRASLMDHFEVGWSALQKALDLVDDSNIYQTIYIRGEPHSIPQAIVRSVTHLGYHVGQIAMVARMVHTGEWKWLTVAPGKSADHNERTWGTSQSRSIFAEDASDSDV